MLGNRLGILAMIAAASLAGCVQIPPEAPALSQELGSSLDRLEDRHTELVGRFFDEKREDVDRFFEEEWLPQYAEDFFNQPAIDRTWQQIVSSGDAEDRLRFVVTTGTRLQQELADRRRELMEPLNELERKLLTEVRSEYRQASAINNSITSFLTSASEVVANRDRLLAEAGIDQSEVEATMQDIDALTTDLLTGVEEVKDAARTADRYRARLQELLDR